MSNKLKAYLAGAMTGLDFDTMNSWRVKAKTLLSYHDIQSINPVDFYNFELDPTLYTDKEVIDFDLLAVKRADIILVNLDFSDSIGTSIEAFYKYKVLNSPVIGFGKNINIHPWIKECITKFCETMEDAVEYIALYYKPIFN